MKTMKLNKEIKRFSDSAASVKEKDGWKYCPKSEWKKLRAVSKKEEKESDEKEEKVKTKGK